MLAKRKILESLDTVLIPGIMRSLVKMNMVRDIAITDSKVDITIASTALPQVLQDRFKKQICDVIGEIDGVGEVEIGYTDGKPGELNKISNVIAIMSGKGGVGKSLVAGLVAIALRRQGYEVGILDGDITGPSIPKMFGLSPRTIANESGVLPTLSKSGIEVMSINLLLPNEDDVIIWRGQLIGKAITQFWEDVLWGKLDYLIVDLPPGTADAPLTVLKTLPVNGVVIVFTPQDLTAMIVRKAVRMVQHMEIPILGVVENMSYLYIPEIDKKYEIFGKSRAEEMAESAKAPLLGKLPIDIELVKLCDEGNIESYESEMIDILGQSFKPKKAEKKK